MKKLPRLIIVATCLTLAFKVQAAEIITLNPAADATMYSENGGLGNGGGQFFIAGKSGAPAFRRSALRFDLSGIPAGSEILSATLQVTVGNTQGINNPVSLYPLTEDWQEGSSDAGGNEGGGTAATAGDTTWTSRNYNTVAWTTAGGSYNNTISASTLISGSGSYSWPSSANLVTMLQDWLDAPATNFGWLVIGDEAAVGASAKQFNSRTGTNPPVLTVNYLLSSYDPVLSVGASAPGTALVDDVITFTTTVASDGVLGDSSDASNVVVSGTYGGTAAYVSGDTNTNNLLELGETWIFTSTYTVLATDPDMLGNTTTVDFEDERGDPHTQTASTSTVIDHLEVTTVTPSTVNAVEGDTVTLTVSANGGHGGYSYAWGFDDGAKAPQAVGTDSPTLSVPNITLAQGGTYTCTVDDGSEQVTSGEFIVNVAAQVPSAGHFGLALLFLLILAACTARLRAA